MGHHTPASRRGGGRRHRRAIQKSRGSKVRRAEGTMETEPAAPASMAGAGGPPPPPPPPPPPTASTTTTTTPSTTSSTTAPSSSSISTGGAAHAGGSTGVLSSGTSGRQTVPQISVYSGISDRQTVQVIQQALHRQPNTAAQYLQQMYAAQQQHLMLQTAALQQQHNLSTAQLQSLAAVQQASMAAGRQGSSQNGTSSQQGPSSQTTINLTTSSGAAQLISRAQSVSSAPTSISQQAVLLGSPSSPATLTASQAQMYLRAQMLIFTPTATVTAVQSESSAQQAASCQVQNLAMRGQQGASMAGPQGQALSLKQTPVPIQPASMIRNPCPQSSASGAGLAGKGAGPADGPSEVGKKAEPEVRAINMSRNNVTAAPPLIAPAYTQIQPHALVTQHKQQQQQHQQQQQQHQQQQHQHQQQQQQHQQQQQQQQHHQFVMQQNAQSSQRPQGQLLQTASIQPCQHPVPVLPKPGPHQTAGPHQATIFHSTINPQAVHASLGHAKAQPVQLTAINLQIQPTASRMIQASKDKPTSLVVREAGPTSTATPHPHPHPHHHHHHPHPHHHHQQHQQQQQQQQPQHHQPVAPPPSPLPPQLSKPAEPQPKASLPAPPAGPPQGVSDKKPKTPPPPPAPPAPPPAMTSGHENESPAVTASAPHNGENKPPQAIVKPQVLTHVIEGFVIQEGAEPFPVERLPVLIHSPKKSDHQLSDDPDKTPTSNAGNTDSEPDDVTQHDKEEEDEPKLTCEYCGWVDFAYKFKGSKRFCSVVCAKRYNVGCSRRMGLFRPERSKPTSHWRKRTQGRPVAEAKKRKSPPSPHQTQGGSVSSPHASQPSQDGSTPCSDMSSYEEPPSPLSAASSGPPPAPSAPPPPAPASSAHRQPSRGSEPEACEARGLDHGSPRHFLPCDPTKWNVEEVSEFIRSLPGCQEIADEFRSQEIDGQALLLLKEDHLMSTMNIKLGPALKIYARINMLKDS
ncbi:unnamed protein product [Lota lota]